MQRKSTSTVTTYSTESPFHNKLRLNFLLSVGLLMIAIVLRIIAEMQYVSTVDPATTPFSQRGLSSSIAYLFGLIVVWYFIYKPKERVSKIFAGLIGINVFIMFIFVPLIVSDMNELNISVFHYLFYLYISFSHLLYAFFYKYNNSKKTVITYSDNTSK